MLSAEAENRIAFFFFLFIDTSLSVSRDSKFFIVNLKSQEIHMWDVAGKWDKPLRYMGYKEDKYVIRSCFGGLNSTYIASGSENSQVIPFYERAN